MSETVISLSAEGIDLKDWERELRAVLSILAKEGQMTIVPPPPPGTFGARRGGNVKVKTTEQVANGDTAIKVIAILLSALSLSISAVQLGLKVSESPAHAPESITCAIVGPEGTRTIQIPQAGSLSEDLVRSCLKETGFPRSITGSPHVKGSPHAKR